MPITLLNFGPLIPASNLRNGAVADIVGAIRASSIPDELFWSPIVRPDDALGLTAPYLSAHIRTAFAFLSVRTAPVGGGVVGDAPHIAALNADAALYLEAAVLGAARAAISVAYRIDVADISVNESVAVLVYARDNAGLYQVVARAPAAPDLPAIAEGMRDPSNVEADLIALVVRMAFCAVPRAGACLLETGHHFLPDQCKRVEAIERQLLVGQEPATVALYRGNEALIRLRVFHSAPHPISSIVLMDTAASGEIAQRLEAAGLGAGGVGLPASEPKLKTAAAYVAMVSATSAAASSDGHDVRIPTLAKALAGVASYPRRGVMVALPEGAPPAANTKAAAITMWLIPAIAAAAPAVAWCKGYYRASLKDNFVPKSDPAWTILGSFAVQHCGCELSNTAGYSAYEMGKIARTVLAKEGKVPGVKLVI